MNREDLQNLKLDDNTVDVIMDLHGKTVEENKSLKKQLSEATSTISELNNKVKDIATVDELKQQIEAQKNEYESKIQTIQYDYEVDSYLSKVKFSNDLVRDAVTRNFKDKNFKFEDGKFLGADEYLDNLKKEQPSAFIDDSKEANQTQSLKLGGVESNQQDVASSSSFKAFY